MRFKRFFHAYWSGLGLLCPPLLAADESALGANTISQQTNENGFFHIDNTVDDTAKPWSTHSDGYSPLTFSLPNGEETYQIVVDGYSQSSEQPPCSEEELHNITVNGQALNLARRESSSSNNAQLQGIVSVRDDKSGTNRSINLLIDTECFHPVEDKSQEVYTLADDYLWVSNTPVVGVSLVSIIDVDGEPWTESRFTVSHRLLNGHVPVVTVTSSNSPTPPEDLIQPFTPSSPDTPILPESPTSPESPSQFDFFTEEGSVIALASHSAPEQSKANNVEKQLRKLQRLRNRLQASQDAVKQQEDLVNRLLGDGHLEVTKSLTSCSIKEPSCIFGKLSQIGREYLNLIFGPSDSPDHHNRCNGMTDMNGSGKSKVPVSGLDDCFPSHKSKDRPSEKDYQPLFSEDDDSHSQSYAFGDSDFVLTSSSSFSGTHNVHTAIGIVASLLCLTCIGTCLHRRCCSPRARAERAARREERCTRLQYRCAARKHAWKDWWDRRRRCFGGRGGDTRRTGDYEEKRALILQQEAVLEHAMQDEIQILRRQTRNTRGGPIDDVLSMVEEGRSSPDSETSSLRSQRSFGGPPSITETLPPYRSRAGSGRPPSYNEFDQQAASVVANGFPDYTPSDHHSVEDTSEHSDDEVRSIRSLRSIRSFRTDRSSPVSSVVDLSPRHSSETLRTERSSV